MTHATAKRRADWLVAPKGSFRLADLPCGLSLSSSQYDRDLEVLQRQLQSIQQAYLATGDRAVVVLEGWDAAGKGGAIRRLTAVMDPRACRVWPIGAPTDREQGKHYLFRFWQRLPDPGTIAIFDRSWYGRVLVERVEGLAPEADWRRAYDEINAFERMLRDDGVRIAKIFLHITADEQLDRFKARLDNPFKRWKLSYEDFRNRRRWRDYEQAIEDMIARTSTSRAPWCVVPANDKKYGRVAAVRTVVDTLSDGVDLTPRLLAPEIAREAEVELGIVVPDEIVARVDGVRRRRPEG